MRRPEGGVGSVYLHRAPIDMRKQMNGLAALVEGAMQQSPFSDSLFVFINRKRDKLKMLLWDHSGFIVWYKRLEQEKFHWPVRAAYFTPSRPLVSAHGGHRFHGMPAGDFTHAATPL